MRQDRPDHQIPRVCLRQIRRNKKDDPLISGRMFQRVKVPNPPDSGKDIAKSKGVLGNWESEGSWRQITGLTNRNHEG